MNIVEKIREYDIDVEVLKKDDVDQETIDIIQDAIDETFRDFDPGEGVTPEMEAETERLMSIEDPIERHKEFVKLHPELANLDEEKTKEFEQFMKEANKIAEK